MNEKEHTHQIDYTVNGEPQSTTDRAMTPIDIMRKAGVDPDTNYLIQLIGANQESYKDTPTKEIHMHEHMKFITNFTGPTPVA
jgi:hypothetical protein